MNTPPKMNESNLKNDGLEDRISSSRGPVFSGFPAVFFSSRGSDTVDGRNPAPPDMIETL